jgi:serine/threonine protein kinase
MASGAAPSVVRAVGSGDPPPPASPSPALDFEEHFTKVGHSLAEGSFGQVFVAEPTAKGEAYLRARLRELGRAVAADAELPRLIVKAPIIDRAKLALLSESEREYREKDAATEKAALRAWHHPGIVTYFGDFISRMDHNRPHLVLEACNGVGVPCDGPVNCVTTGASQGDFWRYVATRLYPSDKVFRFIAWQLLAPVAYLHAHVVAHRDLKNENFLVAGSKLTAAGEVVPVMKISDFGTTRVLTIEEQTGPHPDRSPTLGYGGAFGHADPQARIDFMKYIGTPQHIAPELLRLYDEVERKAYEDNLARRAGGAGAAAKASPLVTFRGQYSTKW